MDQDCRGGLSFDKDVLGEVRKILGRKAKKKVEQHLRNGDEVEKEVEVLLELEVEMEVGQGVEKGKEKETEKELENEVEKGEEKETEVEREKKGMEGMMEFEMSVGSEDDVKKMLMQGRISFEKDWKGGRKKTDAARTPRLNVGTGRRHGRDGRDMTSWEDQEKVADTKGSAFWCSADGRLVWG